MADAAVIGVPDERWQERPLAAVVLRDGSSTTPAEMREYLSRWADEGSAVLTEPDDVDIVCCRACQMTFSTKEPLS